MTETSPSPQPRPKPGPRKLPPVKPDPEEYIKIAKKAVLDNYNESRDEAHAPALTAEDLFLIFYSRTLQNWQVVITSPIARRLLWDVTFNKYRNEVYINVYQKINTVKVSLPGKVQS